MYQLTILFMKFIIFSVIGYVAEMITCAIVEKKWTNRGFFCGPIIPIYGVGSLVLIYILAPFKESILLLALLGMLITTSLEYLTSYVLEKIFHNKWWDYSKEKFNINGRICLKNAVLFALGTPIILMVIDPYVSGLLRQVKDQVLLTTALIILVIFLLDVIYSCVVAYNLRHRLIVVEDLKNEKLARIPGMLERMLRNRLKGMTKYPKRLLNAFPDIMRSKEKEFDIMKKIAVLEKKAKKEQKKKKKKKNKKKKR